MFHRAHLPAALAALLSSVPATAQHDAPEPHVTAARAALHDGRRSEVWRHLDRALASADESRAAHAMLLELDVCLLDDDELQAPAARRVEALLDHARTGLRGSRRAALIALLAAERDGVAPLRHAARTAPQTAERLLALDALLARADPRDRAFVVTSTVLDRSKRVRRQLCETLRDRVGAADVALLARGLRSRDADVRVHTAEAFALLAHPDAVAALVVAAPNAGSGLMPRRAGGGAGTTRGHVAFLEQTSYVRDFDVEVASAAFIADPKIDVLQSGAVLDATLLHVQQVRFVRRAYRRALKSLLGGDPGRDVADWPRRVAELQAAAAERG